MSYNLARNSRVFFTTDVNATTGVVNTGALTSANTFEIQVLDGFSFTQNTQADTVTLSEGGAVPTRGQRSFNTALDPVDFSFSTYLRPYLNTVITAEEKHLWAALTGVTAANDTGVAIGAVTGSTYTPATGTISLTGTAITGFAGAVVGKIYTIKGITAASTGKLEDFNAPFLVTASSATAITGTYLINPSSSATTLTVPTSITLVKSSWSEHTGNALVHFGNSNAHQLMKFGMIFVVDSTAYVVDNAAMDQLSIDFGLDAISTLAWSGKGTALRQFTGTTLGAGTFTAGLTGTFTAKITAAPYIANKLSTMQLASNIGGVSGTNYTVAITGGNLTIANNLTYLTPANIGVVNTPVTYFTGTRAVSGNVTAYLRGIANGTAALLSSVMGVSTTDVDPSYFVQIELGGLTNAIRAEFEMNNAILQIPTVNIDQVVSTQINFTAQGHTAALASGDNDITASNELVVRYYSA